MNTADQLKAIAQHSPLISSLPKFSKKMAECGLNPLKPTTIEILQVNVGKMCNQTCKHCHVDAGPDRKEIMTRETMEQLLVLMKTHHFPKLDLTGGAPEMNPHFRWFVKEASSLGTEIIVRCNLTIINASKAFADLPEFFKQHRVHVISSLPYYEKNFTDRQRGDGVFDSSIKALQKLNSVGYGIKNSNVILDLVYNPAGAFLPGSQSELESKFKLELKKLFNIEFNSLYTITNMPISRYLEWLIESGNYESYMQKLVTSFNPTAAKGVMCRNTISISWDGYIHDCDFNQMLDLKVQTKSPPHINNINFEELKNRSIVVNQHCYGCTAGAGSSCGGALE
jgi:radical SAM/Cys-rich protein